MVVAASGLSHELMDSPIVLAFLFVSFFASRIKLQTMLSKALYFLMHGMIWQDLVLTCWPVPLLYIKGDIHLSCSITYVGVDAIYIC